MGFEITGRVIHVGETIEVSEKFKKRPFVVEYAENPSYPEELQIEAVNDKCVALDELREGDEVTVHFNLRGRAWTNKEGVKQWFNTLSMWKFNINRTNGPGNKEPEYTPPADISSAQEDEDSPF